MFRVCVRGCCPGTIFAVEGWKPGTDIGHVRRRRLRYRVECWFWSGNVGPSSDITRRALLQRSLVQSESHRRRNWRPSGPGRRANGATPQSLIYRDGVYHRRRSVSQAPDVFAAMDPYERQRKKRFLQKRIPTVGVGRSITR